MIAFKSCPRCHGDLLLSIENEVSCIQCGYELKPAEKQLLLATLRSAQPKTPVAA